MKKIFSILTLVCLTLGFGSCDRIFDSLEGDLNKLTGENLASSDAGIQMLLAQVYSYLPMSAFNSVTAASTGRGSSGEEYYTLNACDSHGGDYGFGTQGYYGANGLKTFWNWGAIRSINAFIDIVKEAQENGVILPETAKAYVAEARFVRAYCYFVMVRSYGGVPIITEVLDQYYDGVGNEQLIPFTVRATEKETWDFVLSEFDAAAADLSETAPAEFRANKYAALGMKARAALYAASVSKYWNRQGTLGSNYKAVASKKVYMESSYANDYYNQCIAACEAIIGSGKFSLYGANPANVEEAVKNLGEMFVVKQNSEYIFGKSLDDGRSADGSNYDIENSPIQTVTGGSGSGRYSVASDLVEAFDDYDANFNRVDGTIVTRTDGKETEFMINPIANFQYQYASIPFKEYDNVSDPFKNKDARFQAWVLYPDCTFRNTVIKLQGGIIKTDGKATIWDDDREVVGGVTYYSFGDEPGNVSGFYNYMNTMSGNSITTGFGLRKFLDPTAAQLYQKTFWYDIRYAEILLTYCEAVLESGNSGKFGTAKQYLNDIRHRAAFKDDIDLTIENVLHERRVELAFENDYLYTMHRRREFYNMRLDPSIMGNRHVLTPIVDLRSGSPKYIFLRTLHFAEDAQGGGKQPSYHTEVTQYYKSMQDYGTNNYEPNPVDE